MEVKILKTHPDARMPYREYSGDVCFDLYAVEDVEIIGDEVKKVKFGISWEMPKGYEGVIRPRSSSFAKKNLMVHIGTIDNQYRGEIVALVSLINPHPVGNGKALHAYKAYKVRKGEAVAQVAFRKVPNIEMIEVRRLTETQRANGGFGSTG